MQLSLKLILLICILNGYFCCLGLTADNAYQMNSFLEKWRWSHLEELEGYDIFYGVESHDDILWFIAGEGLIRYDGFKANVIPYPEEYRNIEPYDIFSNDNGTLYIMSSYGVLLYDGDWTMLIECKSKYHASRTLFAHKNGFTVVATPIGIFSVNGYKTQKLTDSLPVSSMVVSGKNDLFVSLALGKTVYMMPFTASGISNNARWKEAIVSEKDINGINLFISGKNDNVIAVDFYKNSSANIYSYESQRWLPMDVGDENRGAYHSSGLKINDELSLIFKKTSINVLNGDDVILLDNYEYNLPSNAPFGFVRKNGNLILGGRGEIITEIDLGIDRWDSYKGLHFQCEDQSGHYWFISIDDEILKYNRFDEKWINFGSKHLSTPTSIIVASDGSIWVSGSHDGVAAVAYYSQEQWKRDILPELVSSVSHLSAHELTDGRICFGSGHEFEVEVGGIVVYSRSSDGYSYEHIESPYVPNRVVGITEMDDGELWFGGQFLTYTNKSFRKPFQFNENLYLDWIDHLTSTKDGNLYIATWLRGLFYKKDNEWINVSSSEHIASPQAGYILNDRVRENNLWVSTNRGISRYIDGEWIPNAISPRIRMNREGGTLKQSMDGAIWINLTSRDWYFRNSLSRELDISSDDFKTIRFLPEKDKPIVEITHYDDTATEPANILVRWSGYDRWGRTPRDELTFSYRINDNPWSEFKSINEVVLMDLQGGNHKVEVRVRDLDGNICEVQSVALFYVKHPIWQRPWFVISGLCMIAVIITLSALLVRQRIRHILQMDEFKLQFFTNLSHEIRTPLTVIMGPLESVLHKLPTDFDKTPIEVAYRNSKKMLHLVDQILEFRRIEIGKIENHLVVSNIVKDIQETVSLLLPLAEEKQISISTAYSHTDFTAYYDSEKLERVLSNLVGNAIKYSYKNGNLSIRTIILKNEEKNNHLIKLIVEDDGLGIRKEKLNHIFEPFYRVQSKGSRRVRGVGLGLSLVRSLVNAMHGKVTVESPAVVVDGKERGARFIVEFPFELAQKITPNADDIDESSSASMKLTEISNSEEENHKPLLLIADDESEILDFLYHEFKEEYQVVKANDGAIAFEKAKVCIPDLIITDILMPVLDGNQLAENIRANSITRHIPIIALTALKNEEHELRSLSKGVDDFLTKPVSILILKQKVKNAIQARSTLLEEYQQKRNEELKKGLNVTVKSVDEEFLRVCREYIINHLDDPLFDVEKLASVLDMSRMTLYRKFRAIAGNTPSEYLREIKMQQAVEMLKVRKMAVSEVADSIGYNEVSNFSSAFKKFYGVTPTKYLQKNR